MSSSHPRSSSGRGGIAPPESAQRCYTPSHKLCSSNGRGENPHPGCARAPRASGDTRLGSHACLGAAHPTRTLAHVPRHRAPHTYVTICIPSLSLPPSISGPMANREVKWAAQVAVCENALRRQQQLGPLFFPLSATQHGKYPKCSLALIPSQARGGDHHSLMLPSVPHSLSPHRYLF